MKDKTETLNKYKEIAKSVGWECLTESISSKNSNSERLFFKCPNGHVWLTSMYRFREVAVRRKRCLYCINRFDNLNLKKYKVDTIAYINFLVNKQNNGGNKWL